VRGEGLFSTFYPDRWVDSAYDIDYEGLYERGFRGVIYDIDNTLVPHGAPADERAVALFERLRAIGLSACLISNNQVPRVKPFADAVGASFVADAHKPSTRNYLQACRIMGIKKEEAFFVGDQLFTDVWGAKRAGIFNILVKPIHPKEEIQIVLKRRLEWIVLHFYKKHAPAVEDVCVMQGAKKSG
jgi:uncharacterized protein